MLCYAIVKWGCYFFLEIDKIYHFFKLPNQNQPTSSLLSQNFSDFLYSEETCNYWLFPCPFAPVLLTLNLYRCGFWEVTHWLYARGTALKKKELMVYNRECSLKYHDIIDQQCMRCSGLALQWFNAERCHFYYYIYFKTIFFCKLINSILDNT